jgi:hypothetical protein
MILIVIFILLLLVWLLHSLVSFIQKKRTVYEGLDNLGTPSVYTPLPTNVVNDPVYLSTLNASNISFLKGKVDEVLTLKQQVNDINSQVATITTTLNGLSQKLSTNVSGSTGCDPARPESCPLNGIAAKAVA